VSNMTDDRLLYPLLSSILGTYRAAFTTATPLVNLTLTQAATALDLQTKWATSGTSAVTGYVQNGRITVTNTAGVAVPITAPTGTTVTGATLASYGGEVSGWLAPGSTTGTLPSSVLTVTGSTTFVVGTAGTINISASGTPTPTISLTGALPTGLTFTAAAGTGVISGVPANATAGSYPLTITAVSGTSTQTRQLVITVTQAPQFTSASSATAATGSAFSFTVTTTGSPSASITRTGTLPTGISFTAGANGTARLSGSPSAAMAGRSFPITLTATNSAGVATQVFTITVGRAPTFSGLAIGVAFTRRPFNFTVQTAGSPTPAITMTGTLPAGVTFVDNQNGTARLSGTPARGTRKTYTLVFKATNVYGTATRTFFLVVI
jgi:large repetitive protein